MLSTEDNKIAKCDYFLLSTEESKMAMGDCFLLSTEDSKMTKGTASCYIYWREQIGHG